MRCGSLMDEFDDHCPCEDVVREEHRGSRPGPDPTFTDAAFRPFTPEQAEMVKEKAGGRR
jgi:hypothetical protein